MTYRHAGSDDNLVCLWDVAHAAAEVSPLSVLRGHSGVVEDVDWSKQQPHLFGSVGDDRQLLLWDSRFVNPAASVLRYHHR